MIEITTKNGYRRLVNREAIFSVGELKGEGASNTVITLSNGEVIFTINTYEDVKKSYYLEGAT